MVQYEFASLRHRRVKPYIILEWQIFLTSVFPALNMLSSIFFTILCVLLQSIVQLVYIIPNLQYHFYHEAHVADTSWSYGVGLGSVVSTGTVYGLDGAGIKSPWKRDFPHPFRPDLRPTQPSL